MQRTALSDADIRSEVEALERQGHRRLLVLTGEHPKYTFDQFLHVSKTFCRLCVYGAANKIGCIEFEHTVKGIAQQGVPQGLCHCTWLDAMGATGGCWC
jgi:2-iminoacetate synthase ThiH